MDREKFMDIVKLNIEMEHTYDVDKYFITQNYKKAKNGIYFLYDQYGIVIYVGMTGNSKTASFYSRMYGNGNSAHCNKPWFSEVKKFVFKSFSKLDKKELILIERLMIYKNNQPRYNDNLMIINNYEIINNKL